jgi:Family of unknown function (DUF6499)
MSGADWRSANAYDALRSFDAPAFAYEFLSRNSNFFADSARLSRMARRGARIEAEAQAFATRWGLRFHARHRPCRCNIGPLDDRRSCQAS